MNDCVVRSVPRFYPDERVLQPLVIALLIRGSLHGLDIHALVEEQRAASVGA